MVARLKGRDTVFSSGRDDWQTPRSLFDPLHEEFGFTLDVAADESNHLLPRWYGPGGLVRDVSENALEVSWIGERCWMNPPYSRNAAFIRKAWLETQTLRGALVVALVPSRTDTRWWHDYIWDRVRHTWRRRVQGRFLKGRVKFVGGRYSAPFPSAIIIFGG